MKKRQLLSVALGVAMLLPVLAVTQFKPFKARSVSDKSAINTEATIPVSKALAVKKLASASLPNYIGAVQDLPWSSKISSQAQFDEFKVIDANADNSTWTAYRWRSRYRARYSRNRNNMADDWLVMPPLRMKGDTIYEVQFMAYGSSFYPERLEVKVATDSTEEALKAGVVIMDSTKIVNDTTNAYVLQFKPEKDGNYYIGFHAVSDANMSSMYLWDVSVAKGADPDSPSPVSNLEAVADPQGRQRATISFNAPTTSIDGNALTSIDSVVVSTNNVRVGAVTGIKPGEKGSIVDENVPINGKNNFSAVAYANGKPSKATAVITYVGLDVPTAPDPFTISDEKTAVLATWNPVVNYGRRGGVVDPAAVTYKLWGFDDNGNATIPVDSVVGDTLLRIPMNTNEGPQQMLQYAISAYNAAGESALYGYSNAIMVGAPVKTPYHESFYVDSLSMPGFSQYWYYSGEGDGYLYGYAGLAFSSQYSSDGDNGSLELYTRFETDKVNAYSGKIKIEGTGNRLIYSLKNEDKGVARLDVNVLLPNGASLLVDSVSIGAESDWTSRIINLPDSLANNEYVQLVYSLVATDYGSSVIYIDNINISNSTDKDLSVSIAAADSVQRGQDVVGIVKVLNNSAVEVSNFKLDYTVNGVVVKTDTIADAIAPFASKEYSFSASTSAVTTDTLITLGAVAKLDADVNSANNTATVDVKLYSFADGEIPANLAATVSKDQVTLTWSTPEFKTESVDESFENITPWVADRFGAWRGYSRDEAVAPSLFGSNALPNEGTNYAYQVMDLTLLGNTKYPGRTGNAFVASLYGCDLAHTTFLPTDKWLVSPTLSGKAQTVKFYANIQQSYSQHLILHYSTDAGTDISKFVPVTGDTIKVLTADTAWVEISFAVPEGAKRFAVQSVDPETSGFWLRLDDFTFEAGTEMPTAYKVYRDGVLVATIPYSEAKFDEDGKIFIVDGGLAAGSYEYEVTAVYGGVDETAPAQILAVVISTGVSEIAVDESKVGNVYDVLGRLVRTNSTSVAGLPAGVYLLNGKKYVVK